jgi:hypothetical protein
MSTLVERAEALAIDVSCTGDELSVVLSDGRTVAVPSRLVPAARGGVGKAKSRLGTHRRGRGYSLGGRRRRHFGCQLASTGELHEAA